MKQIIALILLLLVGCTAVPDTSVTIVPTRTAVPPESVNETASEMETVAEDHTAVYVMNADGSNQRQLTDYAAESYVSNWSPDGRHLLFFAFYDDVPAIYTVDVTSGEQNSISPEQMAALWSIWSPDGQQIAFSAYQSTDYGNRGLYVVQPDGHNLKRLTTDLQGIYWPSWSPDGQQILFSATAETTAEDYSWDIYVINADGSNLRNLTTHVGEDNEPIWSPDGTKIAFTAYRDGNWGLYVMMADGRDLTNLAQMPGLLGSLSWSPDGTQLIFKSNLVTGHHQDVFDVFVVNADGTDLRNLTNHPASDDWPQWSPDGSQIAFTSDRNGNEAIYVMDADGSNPTRLTFADGRDWPVYWSPDGTQLAFNRSQSIMATAPPTEATAVPTAVLTPTTDVANLLQNRPLPGTAVEIDAYYSGVDAMPFISPMVVEDGPACPAFPFNAVLADQPVLPVLAVLNGVSSNNLPDNTAWLVAVSPEINNHSQPSLPFHGRIRGHFDDPAFADCHDAARLFVVEEVTAVYQEKPTELAGWPQLPADFGEWQSYHDADLGFTVTYPPDWTLETLVEEGMLGGVLVRPSYYPNYPVIIRVHEAETYWEQAETNYGGGVYEQNWDLQPFAESQHLPGMTIERTSSTGEPTKAALFSGNGRAYEIGLTYPTGFAASQKLLTEFTVMVQSFRLDVLPDPSATAVPIATDPPPPRPTPTVLSGGSGWSNSPVLSADGRVVAFISNGALALDAVDKSHFGDHAAYLFDQETQQIELVSKTLADGVPFDNIYQVALSGDGRVLAYYSFDGTITSDDPDPCTAVDWSYPCEDLFIYDRQTGQTQRIPRGRTSGLGADYTVALSADGRLAAYGEAGNLLLYDRETGTAVPLLTTTDGQPPNHETLAPVMADNGDIAFVSRAFNLVAGDTNETYDVFVWDSTTGQLSRISQTSDGTEADGMSGLMLYHEGFSPVLDISADGRFVAFASSATTLTNEPLAECQDYYQPESRPCVNVYLHDRQTGELRLMTNGEGDSTVPSLSGDGRYLAYATIAADMFDITTCLAQTTSFCWQIFLLDTQTGELTHVSRGPDGLPAAGNNMSPHLSADGRTLAFASDANNYVPDDTANNGDIFLYDQETGQIERISVPNE